jgi:hypothetical protein
VNDDTLREVRDILVAILKKQQESAAFLTTVLADVETLRLMFSAAHPQLHDRLSKALAANRDRYAQELQKQQAELELLNATVSKWVQ